MAQDIATLGLRVDASQVRDGDKALDAFEKTAKKTEAATENLAQKTKFLTNVMAALAAAVTAFKLASLIKESALLSARFETMGVVMGVAGNNAGYTRMQMAEFEKQLQKTGISMIKSRETLTAMATANIDLAKSTELARAAQDLAVVGNLNSSEAMARLIHGIQSGEVEILRTIGLNVNFENSYKKMALQVGVHVDKLSDAQKMQARTNVALQEATKFAGIYEQAMGTAGKQINSLTRYWEDLKVKLGDAFLPALTDMVFKLSDGLKAANSEMDKAKNSTLADVATSLAKAFRVAYETVAILGANVLFTFAVIGKEIAGFVAGMQALATGNLAGARAISAAVGEETAAMRAALDAYEAKILGTNKATAAATQAAEDEAKQQMRLSVGKEEAAIAAGRSAREAQAAEDKRLKAAGDAMKLQAKYDASYTDSIKAIHERTAALALDDVTQGKLTEGQKFAIKILEDLRTGELKLSTAKKIKLAADLEEYLRQERLTKAHEDDAKAQQETADRLARETGAVWDQVIAMQAQLDTYGLIGSAVIELQKTKVQAQLLSVELSAAETAALESQLAGLTKLATLTRELEGRDLVKKQAEQARTAWQKTADVIESALTDSLMRAFEKGKGFAETARDTIVAMFKTMILRPVVQAIGQAGASMAGNALGVVGAAGSAASGVSSILGGVGTAGTLYGAYTSSSLGQFMSGFSGSAGAAAEALGAPMTGAASAGNSVANGLSGAAGVPYLGIAGGGLAAYGVGQRIGGVGGAVAGGVAGAGTVALGGAITGAAAGTGMAAGAMTALAAIPVWGWVAIGALAVLGSMQDGPESATRLGFKSNNGAGAISINERGNEGKSDKYVAGVSSDGAFGSFGVASTFWMEAAQPSVQAFVKSVTATDDALAKFMTSTEKAAAITAVNNSGMLTSNSGAEGSDPNGLGGLDSVFRQRLAAIMDAVDPALQKLLDGFQGTTQELAAEAVALLDYRKNLPEVSEALFGVVVTVQDLIALRNPLETMGAALSRVTTAFTVTNAIAESLGLTLDKVFGEGGLGSLDARQRLIDLAGGVDALSAGASYFAQTFMTDAERLAPVIEAVTKRMGDLGFAGVATAAGYKKAVIDLVESGALATEAGASTYVELLKLGPGFKLMADSIKGTAETVAAVKANAEEATDTYQTFGQAFADSMTNATAAAAALRDFNDALKLGNLSTLSKGAQYDVARAGLDMNNQASVTAFLTASQARGGSKLDYARDFAMVSNGLDAAAAAKDATAAAIPAMWQSFMQAQPQTQPQVASGWDGNFNFWDHPDGSHADGLARVPRNGYRAILHEGESVKTAAETREGDEATRENTAVLREVLAELRTSGRHVKDTASVLQAVTRGGTSFATEPA